MSKSLVIGRRTVVSTAVIALVVFLAFAVGNPAEPLRYLIWLPFLPLLVSRRGGRRWLAVSFMIALALLGLHLGFRLRVGAEQRTELILQDLLHLCLGSLLAIILDQYCHMQDAFQSSIVEASAWKRKADEQLRLTASILNNSTLAMFILDPAGRVTYMNPMACSLTGFSEGELRGRLIQERLSPLGRTPSDDGSVFSLLPIAQLDQPTLGTRETIIRTKSGRKHAISYRSTVIQDADRAVGILVEARDITDEKQRETALYESEQRFKAFIDASPAIAWSKDAHGRYVFFSTGSQHHGCWVSSEQVIGRTDHELYPSALAEQLCNTDQQVRKTLLPVDRVFEFADSSGDARHWRTFTFPYRDGFGQLLLGGLAYDVTERLKIQQDQIELTRRLEEADRRKDEFLATLAHELRNPLASIRSGIEVLRLAEPESVLAQQTRETLERQTQHLVALVDDLLDVSRITKGRLELRRSSLDANELMLAAIEATRSIVENAHHQLIYRGVDRKLVLIGDKHRLMQVVVNLIHNAAKYTSPGGRIELSLAEIGRTLEIRCRDNGMGIPPEYHEQIFDPFGQAPEVGLHRQEAGLGIGLTLVRSIVNLHGGSVSVQSEGLGKGSEFIVRLPIIVPDGTVSDQEPKPAPSPRISRRILVGDDNVAAAKLMGKVLELHGHTVRIAHHGREAIEISESYAPEIVFLDLGMPVMNGFEAAKEFRRRYGTNCPKLVAVTGWGQAEDRQRSLEAGFDVHLVKPVAPDRLEAILQDLPVPRPPLVAN